MDRAARRGLAFALLLCAAASPRAHADEAWLVVGEASAALPVTTALRDRFKPGMQLGATGYRSLTPALLGGLRLRGGLLLNGPRPANADLADPGLGGWAAALAVVRYRPLADTSAATRAAGLWTELGGGAGMTGKLIRGTAEVGLGWNFTRGPLFFGPALRYLHVVQPRTALDGADAGMVLVGLEVGFFDPQPAPPAPPPPKPVVPRPPPPSKDTDGDGIVDPSDKCVTEPEDRDGFEDADGCPDPDNDKDGIADANDKCPNEAEVVNAIADDDGCPDVGLIEVKNDRIVLEERVLFDKNRARVKSRGKPVLRAVLDLWKQQGNWDKLIIEGHADVRGPDQYNNWLSEERATRVRAALIELGFPADKVEDKHYGRSRPVTDGSSEEDHQRNRRVEFVIVRPGKDVPTGTATSAGERRP